MMSGERRVRPGRDFVDESEDSEDKPLPPVKSPENMSDWWLEPVRDP